MRFPVVKVFLALLFTMIFGASVLTGSKAMAQAGPQSDAQVTGTSQTDRIAALEKQAADNAAAIAAAQTAGDNGWMLVSAALVLMMSGPGLALFYGGLVRKKNILGTMMQSFSMMAVITVLWALVGYSLAFGEGSAFIGDLRYLFLNGVGSAPNA